MNPDSLPAQDTTPVVPVTPDYSSPNDLDFEMSAEEEQAFVNQILGTDAEEAVATPVVVEPPVVPDTPVTPDAPAAPVVPDPQTPEAPVTPEAIKTDDLWIEVEKVVTDDLGETTLEKVKLVYDPLNPDSFVPDDFVAKNDKQRMAIMEAKAEIANEYNERKSEFDTFQKDVESKEAVASAQKAQLDSWDAEIATLIEVGALDAPKAKQGDANYLDDPAVKKTDEVFQFMAKTNAERAEKGLPPVTSFGTVLTMYEKDASRVAAEEAKRQANADTKAKGALVGGSSSASAGGDGPKPYVAGSARNIWDVKAE